jgi:diguanylate cyclase (GGDEF)-like protein/PAS domain S-box-containing protein
MESAEPDSETRSTPQPDGVPVDVARAHIRAFETILNLDGSDNAFLALFANLQAIFANDEALVIEGDGDAMACMAASPNALTGQRWPACLQNVLAGQVQNISADHDLESRPPLPADLVAHGQSALMLPIGVGTRRAALVLRRNGEKGDFGAGDVAFARQCAVVALAGLAAQTSGNLATEIDRLNRLVAELRQSGLDAQRDRDFFKTIVDLVPVGVTVQDDTGRFILVNTVAAANLETPADVLVGASPADFLSEEEAAQRRQWEADLLRSGELITAEETVSGPNGERTWLSSHKSADILDRNLLLSTSLDITDRKDIEKQLAKRAYFDDLTDLPNRVLVEERVEEALRRGDAGGSFALAFLDLDNFKHINDYFSHAIGDALLVRVAQRIRECLRPSDMLARISGDEFLLLLDPVETEEQIRTIIDRIVQYLKAPFHIEGFEVFSSASLGVSVYPEHGTSYEALRRNADNAMYRAKSELKGGAIYFDLGMGEKIHTRMELEQRLRLAIRDGKFCCAFQPKVDIHSEEVVGFETLVRWRDEAGEIQLPSSFIGLAIELGLIDPITQFVLAETVASIERLDAAFGTGTTFSINIAAKQAGDLNFMQSLVDLLKQSRYAERIMLELTEEAFVAKSRFQMQVLPMLREIGVRVSIDDFGTGYSSLSVLADITADEIKVDRSFVTGIHQRPRSQSVLRTIESLCLALGMSVVAEGVETFEELTYLRTASRIRCAQGYFFSKPFFLEDLTDTRRSDPDGRAVTVAREQAPRRSSNFSRVSGGRE